MNSWATGPSVVAARGHVDTVSGFRESSQHKLLEAGRDISCFSGFSPKHPLRPLLGTGDGARRTRAGLGSTSDLVLLPLTALGKIISDPKHLQATESKERPGERG